MQKVRKNNLKIVRGCRKRMTDRRKRMTEWRKSITEPRDVEGRDGAVLR